MEQTRSRLGVALGLLSCCLSLAPVGAKEASRPNIILMMCDDLGWGDVGFNGGTTIRTPHLDAMAGEGMRFARFYSAAPVCSPTRGSCLTGRHPYRYEIPFANSGHMKPEEWTLAEALGDVGYRTGHFGKWHLGTLTKTVVEANRGGPRGVAHFSPPQRNGFDVCFSAESKVPTYDPMRKPIGAPAGGHWDALQPGQPSEAYGTHYWNEREEMQVANLEGGNPRVIMDRAATFLRDSVAQEAPFFAVIWFHSPHLPVVGDPAVMAPYRDYPVHQRNYYGCVTAMDQQVGRLRALLAELEVDQNTLTFFASDNGPEGPSKDPGSAGPFRGRKRSLYEGGVRVPAFVHYPRSVSGGGSMEAPCVTSDYLPTILRTVGLERPDSRPLDGRDLWPLIQGDVRDRESPIGFISRNQRSWVDDRWKLISQDAGASWALYDVEADPGETRDRAVENPDRVGAMKTAWNRWFASVERSASGADY